MKLPYIDIHNHSLPGVDDGARSLDESIFMLRQAADEGIGTVILTPHQKPGRECADRDRIEEKVRQLQTALDEQQIPVKLNPGAEVLYSYDMTAFLRREKACPLADSHYVLTEFLPDAEWTYIQNGVYELRNAGYIPVIAHTERCLNVACDLDRVDELRESGCLIQINAGNLTGLGMDRLKKSAKRLVKEQLADIVATDAHRASGSRQVRIADCAAWIRRKCGTSYAERLLYENAAAILKDEEIPL